MDTKDLPVETRKQIEAEAKRLYPVIWRHRTPSERAGVFDDGLDSRSAFMAGAAYVISREQELRKQIETKDRRIKALEDGLKGAVEVIKAWHRADDVWDIYLNHAPEMKEIKQLLNK